MGAWGPQRPNVSASEAAKALALAATAYYIFSLSRYMAAFTAEMILDAIYRLATSPVEASVLAALTAWLVGATLGNHSRAAQALSALQLSKLLGAAIASAQQQASGKGGCQNPSRRRQLVAPPSPGKDISSYRLPDHSLPTGGKSRRRRASVAAAASASVAPNQPQMQQRWSMDALVGGSGTQQMVRAHPKPRTSVDFDASAPTSPAKGPRNASATSASRSQAAKQRRSRRSLADHRSAPQLGETSSSGSSSSTRRERRQQRERQWQPRMQRIASGQDLAELAMAGLHTTDASSPGSSSSRASCESDRSSAAAAPAEAADAQNGTRLSPAAAVSASTAASAAPAALSSWLPTLNLLPWAPLGSSASDADAASASEGAFAAGAGGPLDAATAALDAVSRWAASTGTVAAATLDSMLRPLIPGGGRPALDSLLWRSPSAPLEEPSGDAAAAAVSGCGLQHAPSAPAAVDRPAAADAAALPVARRRLSSSAASDRRRQSVDGVSARHYTHGGVTADPNRFQALENLAAAARLQSASSGACLPGLRSLEAGSTPLPGHPALASGTAGGAPLGADVGRCALASVGLDGDCPEGIRGHVTDEHLLQFAAVVGEEACAAAAAELALPSAWADAGCLLGAAAGGGAGCSEEGWEQVICRSEGGLSYEVWRQPLRAGLYMYRSRTVFQGVSPRDLRPFHLDDHARHLWDENVLEIKRVKPQDQSACQRLHKHSEWCLHQYRSRFPRPMAAREYQYARRVWHRPSDGGCYALCRGLALPDAGDSCRAVKVTDIFSGCVIRLAPGDGGAELVSLYFEDSGVRPGLAKMAVKGMWAYMQGYDAALRVFADARRAAEAEYASGTAGALSTRRPSLDGTAAPPHRRRRPVSGLRSVAEQAAVGAGAGASVGAEEEEEDDTGSSSGDDELHSTYAAMAQRLRRATGGPRGRRARYAGRVALLAGIGIRMLLTIRR